MKQNVVIIGGGIAGMEAANQLQLLGYNPIIVERESTLGGHVAQWHRLFPDMSVARDVIGRLSKAIASTNVFLDTSVVSVKSSRSHYTLSLSNGVDVTTRVVLVATGFGLFDARKKEEYGYGVYDRVITNGDLEQWMNGRVDTRVPESPRSVGFVHCVGSRDLKAGNNQCSKVCCMTAVKQAIEMKELFPDSELYCFYMDLRLFGKKYEDFYINAQRDFGVHFVRGRVSEVGEDIEGRLCVKAEDTLMGKPLKIRLDLLVLMAGMVCHPQTPKVAEMLRLDVGNDGFFKSRDNLANIQESNQDGVFYAGACTGAKTIPETLSEARAVALRIHSYFNNL